MDEYLSGLKLYGDDLDLHQIQEWFSDEQEGYAQLGAKDRAAYHYSYHALNQFYGFRYLPNKRFNRVLGVGAAYGDELKPIIGSVNNATILEPSDSLVIDSIEGVPVSYVKPVITAELPFEDEHFDLVTCFGVLHHIPNVTKMVSEIYRCAAKDGYVLIREPVVSFGNWQYPRRGLTKHERGIPIRIFRSMLTEAGFKIVSENKCMFSLTPRLKYISRQPVYNSRVTVQVDRICCKLFGWNNIYHAENVFQKLRPSSVFYVLTK